MSKLNASPVSEDELLTYGAYLQIAEALQHYNRVQTTYRTFTSTWLLATFIGIGYSLSSKEVNLPFHPLIIVAFICLASATGILLVWHMDLIVYEQSIAAVVYEGIELESRHPWLPRFYNNVNEIRNLMGYVSLKSVFYIGCLFIIIATFGSALTLYTYLYSHKFYFLIPALTLAAIILIHQLLVISAKRTDPYNRLKNLREKSER